MDGLSEKHAKILSTLKNRVEIREYRKVSSIMIVKRRRLRILSILLAGTLAFSVILLASCSQSIEKMKLNGDIEGLIEAATYKLNTYSDELNESRNSAREALLDIGAPAVEPLINTLNSDDQSVVGVAIELLGEMQDPRAAQGLIDYRFYSSIYRQPARDMEAEDALYKMGPTAFDPIIDTLKSNNSEAFQFAFDFLEFFEEIPELKSDLIHNPRYIEALIELIQNDEYMETALYRLSRSADASIMEVMVEYMDQDVVSDGYFTEINVQYIQPVLDGQGIKATPYQTSSPSLHPVVISDEGPFLGFRTDSYDSDPPNWNAYLPLSWRALGKPQSIQLVLCWDKFDLEVIETANYSDGSKQNRYVRLYSVTLREASTGKIIASDILRGKDPEPFPAEKIFGTPLTYIGQLTPEMLINWLRPYVEE